MKLSISNIAWNYKLDHKVLKILQTHNIDGIEIAPTKIIPEHPYDHISQGKEYAAMLYSNYHLKISSMQSIWFGRTENIFRSRQEMNILKKYTQQAICFAEALNCKNLVFGCPKNRNIEQDFDSINFDEIILFFNELGEYAYAHQTCLAIEPNPVIYNTNFINTTTEAFKLVNQINSKGIRVNLDLGTIIENKEVIDDLDFTYINHIHISEPNLKKIEKRTLHKEIFQLAKASNYKKYFSIEMGELEKISDLENVLDYIIDIKESV